MGDPTGYIAAKIASMVGGLFGGFAILTFIKPRSISEAFMRGGCSVGSAMVFGQPMLVVLDIESNWETQLMSGFCVGFLAYTILGMIANYIKRHHDKDIVEAVKHAVGKDESK